MSIFASFVTATIPVPDDPGQTVTIQKLSYRAVELAKREYMKQTTALFRDLGGAQFRQELATTGDDEARAKRIAEAQADPLNGFDRGVLLAKGIKGWSYDYPVDEEHLADLDAEASEFLAREILALTYPNGDAGKKNS